MSKDILQPINTTNSSSPSIHRAATEPANWRAQGEQDVKTAINNSPTKHPIAPETNK